MHNQKKSCQMEMETIPLSTGFQRFYSHPGLSLSNVKISLLAWECQKLRFLLSLRILIGIDQYSQETFQFKWQFFVVFVVQKYEDRPPNISLDTGISHGSTFGSAQRGNSSGQNSQTSSSSRPCHIHVVSEK